MRKSRRASIFAQRAWADGYKNCWVPVRWYATRNPRRTGAAIKAVGEGVPSGG